MTVVIKVGGSLLTLPGLVDKLRCVLDQRPNDMSLLVTGGGAAADAVRDWSDIHSLNDEDAHWLAISGMDLNRQLLEVLSRWKSVATREEAQQHWRADRLPMLANLCRFLRTEESRSDRRLPHIWDVTSDSIAAWTAHHWPAQELILLKSIPTPHGLTAQQASEQSLVDPYFHQIAKQLDRISWCNLRAPEIVIERWL